MEEITNAQRDALNALSPSAVPGGSGIRLGDVLQQIVAAINAPTVYVTNAADETARDAAVPAFVGQLLVQLDTDELYRADGDEAGDWTLVVATAAA